MSRSSGTGSPIHFMCSRLRKLHRGNAAQYWRHHRVALTGRWRRNTSGNVVGRSTRFRVQYECSCGHVGWTNHRDLVRRAVSEEVVPTEVAREDYRFDKITGGR